MLNQLTQSLAAMQQKIKNYRNEKLTIEGYWIIEIYWYNLKILAIKAKWYNIPYYLIAKLFVAVNNLHIRLLIQLARWGILKTEEGYCASWRDIWFLETLNDMDVKQWKSNN